MTVISGSTRPALGSPVQNSVHLEEVRILEPVLNAISQTNLAYSTPYNCQQTFCYLTAFLTSRIQQEQVQRQNQVYHLPVTALTPVMSFRPLHQSLKLPAVQTHVETNQET